MDTHVCMYVYIYLCMYIYIIFDSLFFLTFSSEFWGNFHFFPNCWIFAPNAIFEKSEFLTFMPKNGNESLRIPSCPSMRILKEKRGVLPKKKI